MWYYGGKIIFRSGCLSTRDRISTMDVAQETLSQLNTSTPAKICLWQFQQCIQRSIHTLNKDAFHIQGKKISTKWKWSNLKQHGRVWYGTAAMKHLHTHLCLPGHSTMGMQCPINGPNAKSGLTKNITFEKVVHFNTSPCIFTARIKNIRADPYADSFTTQTYHNL